MKGRAPLAVALLLALGAAAAYGYSAPGPVLWQVAPQPGATLLLRQVPLTVQLSRPYQGVAALFVDGRRVAAGLPAPYLSYLPPAPLAPGRHTLRVDTLTAAGAFSYRWDVDVAERAQRVVGAYDAATYQALAAVNQIRSTLGIGRLRLSGPLEAASRAHSAFFLKNLDRYRKLSVAVHTEQPSWPDFVGRTPWARDVAFGYNGDGDSEVMAFGVGTVQAVELWLDSVYHRFGLIDPGLTSMGFGISGQAGTSSDLPVTTLNAGFESQAEVQSSRAVVWPVPGQAGVPVEFEEGEMPDPLANFKGASYPAGYPVTVSFFGLDVKGLRIASATLQRSGMGEVACHLLTPQVEQNKDELGMSAALLPARPLAAGQGYQAVFRGSYRDSGGWHPFRVATAFRTAQA